MTDHVEIEWSRVDRPAGRRIVPLEGVISIGSDDHCDVVLTGAEVAAQHLFVLPAGQAMRLVCRGGLTFSVGGIALTEAPPTRVARIEVGPWHLTLSLADGSEADEPTLTDCDADSTLADIAQDVFRQMVVRDVSQAVPGRAARGGATSWSAENPEHDPGLGAISADDEPTLAELDPVALRSLLTRPAPTSEGVHTGRTAPPGRAPYRVGLDPSAPVGGLDSAALALPRGPRPPAADLTGEAAAIDDPGVTQEVPPAMIAAAIERVALIERSGGQDQTVEAADEPPTVETDDGPWKRIPRRPTGALSEADELSLDPTVASQLPLSVVAALGAGARDRTTIRRPPPSDIIDRLGWDGAAGAQPAAAEPSATRDMRRPPPPPPHRRPDPAPQPPPPPRRLPPPAPSSLLPPGSNAIGDRPIPVPRPVAAPPARAPGDPERPGSASARASAGPRRSRAPGPIVLRPVAASSTPPDLPWSLSSPGRVQPSAPPAQPQPQSAPEPEVAVRPLPWWRALWHLIGGRTIDGRSDSLPLALLISALAQIGFLALAAALFEPPVPAADLSGLSDRYIEFITREVRPVDVPPDGDGLDEEPIPEPVEQPAPAPPKPKPEPTPIDTPTPPLEEEAPEPKPPETPRQPRGQPRRPTPPLTPVEHEAKQAVDGMMKSSVLDNLDDPSGLPQVPGGVPPASARGGSGMFGEAPPTPGIDPIVPEKTQRERLERARDLRDARTRQRPVEPELDFAGVKRRLAGGSEAEQRAIRAVLSAAGPRFRGCLERTALRYPDIEGRIALSFDIPPDGRPTGVRSAIQPRENEMLSGCTRGVVERLRFEVRKGDRIISVTYPLLIRRSD